MSNRLYLKPELAVREVDTTAMISSSLPVSNYSTDTPGRSREYDGFDSGNSKDKGYDNNLWDQMW
jgi:hypothetical protein